MQGIIELNLLLKQPSFTLSNLSFGSLSVDLYTSLFDKHLMLLILLHSQPWTYYYTLNQANVEISLNQWNCYL